MITLHECKVWFQDGVHEDLERARISILGTENAQCVITAPAKTHDGKMKLRRVDRLTSASYTQKGRDYVITGISDHLRREVQTDDVRITVTARPGKGCTNCR